MKIVVAYKWAPNPQDATVDAAGVVTWGRASYGISEYDPVAIELARRFAVATGAEVVGLTAGTTAVNTAMARKAALSRGLDRLVVIADDALEGAATTELAAVLAAAVRHIGDVDLVMTGDSSVDIGSKMLPTVLAGLLGWAAVAEVTAVSGEPDRLSVQRAFAGSTQTFEILGPAVVAAATDAAVPHVPGMKDLLSAGKKPVETLDLAALEVQATTGSKVTLRASAPPNLKARKGRMIDVADPAAAAAELVGALRGDGLL